MDNFAHVGGLITGILAGMIFIPSINFGCINQSLTCLAMPALFTYFVVLISVFYAGIDGREWCSWCVKIDCLEALFTCN